MPIITPEQSRLARRELGLSQAAVADGTGLNRQYISEYETGHTSRLTNGNQRKLRAFYEGKIDEAREAGDEIDLEFGDAAAEPQPATVETFAAKRCVFPIAAEVSDELMSSTLGTIAENDKRLAALLTRAATRERGLFSSGELSAEALDALRESFALLSANYLLIRTLGGWPEIGLAAENVSILKDTVLATIIGEVRPAFEQAGLIGEARNKTEVEHEEAAA